MNLEIVDEVGPRFNAVRPANVSVEVSRLVDREVMVGIEADAWLYPSG